MSGSWGEPDQEPRYLSGDEPDDGPSSVSTAKDSLARLRQDVTACERCTRLREHCLRVARERKKAHCEEIYWGRPVPDFGDDQASLLIIGLAPAAHGANRTGRMFTGDKSGLWLYRALHRAGFANQFSYEDSNDGLELKNCAIAATVRCAPPDNRPTPDEIRACSDYLSRSFQLRKPVIWLALGGIAWRAIFTELKKQGLWRSALPRFQHAAEIELLGGRRVLASYHPSQQNTFTGRLTEPMFDGIFTRARELLDETQN